MQAIVILIYFSKNAWLTMLAISTITVLPAYFASAAYLLKLNIQKDSTYKLRAKARITAIFSSVVSIIFCLFMLYASDFRYVAMTPLLITLGLPFFIWARKKDPNTVHIFAGREWI